MKKTRIVGAHLVCALIFGMTLSLPLNAKTINYQLTIQEQKINITGKETTALLINNQLPGPTLKASVGDIFRVEVKNNLNTETSIHWHGVLVPNRMDGVPYITSPPIEPGKTFIYEFPIKHSGTYWYHAHSGLQEQQGIYGALVFYPENINKNKDINSDYDEEQVIVISDWTNEKPENVLAHIKQDPDYYALKKDSVQSWHKILLNGSEAIKLRINNAFNKMGPMDISDIGYDAFLINGKKATSLSHAKAGSRVKLRIINAGASSYFILNYAGGVMKVIATDGVNVQPFTANRIRIAMAETYDVIVTVPENKRYEFRASSEDGAGFVSGYVGTGEILEAETYPKPNLVMMNHHEGGHQMPGMSGMDHGTSEPKQERQTGHVDFLNNYKILKSPIKTTLLESNPVRTVELKLTGSMERYVWTINNTPMYASDSINIKKGDNVKFILINETMMHHPIHLHGHFFRVLNGQGDYSPLKHTVNVAPFETVEIEFEADKEQDWIFHCHNLYHMKLGMGGIIHYAGTQPDADVKYHHKDHSAEHGNIWFNANELNLYSNLAEANLKYTRNNDYIIFDGNYNYHHDYELELYYKKYLTLFFGMYIGGNVKYEDSEKLNRAIIGVEYILPLLIKADFRLNSKGKPRFGLANAHQLTNRVSFEWDWNTDSEYTLGLSFEINKQFYLSGNYDATEKFGVGFVLKF
jgi:FtsP/CotA-like multicopper oxidase with cupredoxin domain